MAYFDNAATTYPKPECVYHEMDSFYRSHGGSAGRGTHEGAKSAGMLIAETRDRLKFLFMRQIMRLFYPNSYIGFEYDYSGND